MSPSCLPAWISPRTNWLSLCVGTLGVYRSVCPGERCVYKEACVCARACGMNARVRVCE